MSAEDRESNGKAKTGNDSPQSALHGGETSSQPTKNEKYDTEKLPAWKDPHWWQVWIGIILVPVGAYALCIYHGQLEEMRKATDAATEANKLSSQIAHIQERAWVSAMTTFQQAIQPNQPFSPTVAIQNTGQSFAMSFKFSARMTERPRGTIATLADEKATMVVHNGGILAPQEKLESHIVAPSPNEKQVKRILDGDTVLFLLGWTTYYDIFDCVHWTIFCYQLDPKDWKWYGSEIGNDADNNKCP